MAKLFGNVTVYGSPKTISELKKRENFIIAYCGTRGWEAPLSMEQILEIRQQEGCKPPE